jgi:hypothetical protein
MNSRYFAFFNGLLKPDSFNTEPSESIRTRPSAFRTRHPLWGILFLVTLKYMSIGLIQTVLHWLGPIFGIPLADSTRGNDTIFGFVLLFILEVVIIGFFRLLWRK